jgi:hypothetical protein
MLRLSESGKHSRSTPAGRRLPWRRLTVTALLAGAAGALAFAVFPGGGTAPVADQLTRGTAGAQAGSLLGHGQAGSYNANPAPIVTATASKAASRRRHPQPAPTPTAPASSAPPAATVTPFTAAGGVGIYDGQSKPSGIETAASWLGATSDIKYAEDFIDATDWSHISNPWQLSQWKGSPFTMIWGVPMLPCGAPATQCATNVSDFNMVADGGANSYFKTLAQNLVGSGFGSSYIRLGWEMNGTWMGWSICNSSGSGLTSWANDFVPAFRNIVTSMRSVSGANFKFIWNPLDSSNVSCAGAKMENFYPGDAYVDNVSLDVYDGIGGSESDSARWSDMLNGVNAGGWTAVQPDSISGQSFPGYGLNWLAAFGKEHDKQVGLPEWGLCTSDNNGGGGDDTTFMSNMTAWIKANATGPAIFWNQGGGTIQLSVPSYTSGSAPNASALFKSAFS